MRAPCGHPLAYTFARHDGTFRCTVCDTDYTVDQINHPTEWNRPKRALNKLMFTPPNNA